MQGILYVVGTPIGNLGDFSLRAAETLNDVDFIAAEDTRVTQKLLNRYGIKKPVESYHEHNKKYKGDLILKRLLAGESCALVTDAGMPAISDPGEDLVALCAGGGIEVVAVPGPCAAVTALAVSGLPSGRFCFEGFLSVNKKNRREHLESLKDERRTLLFYEAPHKLRDTLSALYEAFGNRRVAVVRELTKLHEETLRTTLQEAMEYYSEKEPRGEYVLVVDGCGPSEAGCRPADENSLQKAAALVEQYAASGCTHAQAVKRAVCETHVSRSELYRLTLPEDQ